MSVISINEGTATATPSDTVGTVKYPVAKIDVGAAGSSVPWQGSVTLSGGTVTNGTIRVAAGTINLGTVETVSTLPANNWGTVINTGTSALGTLKAAVGGSSIYITDLTISAGTPTNVALYNGATTILLYGTLNFNANGGIVENFRVPLKATSGSQILFKQSIDGNLSINAQGFVL